METKLPQTFDECLAIAGTEREKSFFSNPELMAQFESDEIAYKKMKVITRALNTDQETKEAWTPDWSNYDQGKYYPWFDMDADEKDAAGVGFSFLGYDSDLTLSDVGSRLCFKSRELAKYAGQQFTEIYKEYFVIKK